MMDLIRTLRYLTRFLFLLDDIERTSILLITISVVILILQLLLCYKAKKLFIRLLPSIVFVVSTVVLYFGGAYVDGNYEWELLFCLVISFRLIFACGVAWLIWAIFRKINKIKQNKNADNTQRETPLCSSYLWRFYNQISNKLKGVTHRGRFKT